MRRIFFIIVISIMVLIVGCTNCKPETTKEKTSELVFPKGEKITNNNFTGTVWLHMVVNKDSLLNTSIGNVTFEPGARTNWHYHPGGQILLITSGLGYYQEKGHSIQLLHKGDVIKCPPYKEHWHGASPDSSMTHIAIGPNLQNGNVVWLQTVTEDEYKNLEVQ